MLDPFLVMHTPRVSSMSQIAVFSHPGKTSLMSIPLVLRYCNRLMMMMMKRVSNTTFQTSPSASHLVRTPHISSFQVRWDPTWIDRRGYTEIWHLRMERVHLWVQRWGDVGFSYLLNIDEIGSTHALALLSLISSSHCSRSHQGMTTTFLPSRAGTRSSQSVMALSRPW